MYVCVFLCDIVKGQRVNMTAEMRERERERERNLLDQHQLASSQMILSN